MTAILPACLITSCDYLDILPPEQTSAEDTMETNDRMYNFLSSCYHAVLKLNPVTYDKFYQSTDEFVNPPLWQNEGQKVSWNQMNGGSVPDIWSDSYSYIGQCHRFLRQLDALEAQDKIPENSTKEDLKICRDEIAFLKAYYHYRLLEAFGPIPIVEEMPSQNVTADKIPGRMHYDYCVDYLAKLFDEAVNNLPATRGTADYGRATSTAAKAIKSRMLVTAASPLWNGNFPFPEWKNKELTGNVEHDEKYGLELVSHTYDKSKWERALEASLDALQYAEGVGERKLFDKEEALKAFSLWNDFNVNNNASIVNKEALAGYGDLTKIYVPNVTDVVKRYVDGDNNNDPTEAEFIEAREFLARVVIMRMMPLRYQNDGSSEFIWQYYQDDGRALIRRIATFPTRTVLSTTNQWLTGWAGLSPTLYTVEHFYTKNGLLPSQDAEVFPSYSDEEIFSRAGITDKNREDIVKLHINREPRFYAWIGYDGDDYAPIMNLGKPLILDMNSSNDAKDGSIPGQYYSDQYNRNYSQTGYLTKKWCQINQINTAETGDGGNWTRYPMPIIRLAELYLNVAECYAALDDETNAIKYLNPIRERAGVPALTSAMVENSGMDIMEWVRAERFIEFYAESQRYNDVRRWMTAPEQLAANKREGLFVQEFTYNPSVEEFNRRTIIRQNFQWEDRMYILPIANSEIYASRKLVQAPNY